MPIKAVLYDLDGVLMDACDWHYDALNKALMEICGFKIGRKEHDNIFNGLPTKKKFEILIDSGRVLSSDYDEVTNLKQRYTLQLLAGLEPDPVKIELHRQVLDMGIKIACVTNAIRQSAETMLQKTGQLQYMQFVISNQDIVYPKPCGEGYVVAMVSLGVLPQDTLIVEDSPKGIQAAKSTGAHVLQVANATEVTWNKIGEALL